MQKVYVSHYAVIFPAEMTPLARPRQRSRRQWPSASLKGESLICPQIEPWIPLQPRLEKCHLAWYHCIYPSKGVSLTASSSSLQRFLSLDFPQRGPSFHPQVLLLRSNTFSGSGSIKKSFARPDSFTRLPVFHLCLWIDFHPELRQINGCF